MRETIRHTLATLAYRTAKTLRDPPGGFPYVELGHGVRTPLKILSHMTDLVAFTVARLEDRKPEGRSRPGSWADEEARFFDELGRLDELVASGAGDEETLKRLLQGPIADALTHVGQLAILRRVGGSPIQGESFYRAEIEVGRVGPDQALP